MLRVCTAGRTRGAILARRLPLPPAVIVTPPGMVGIVRANIGGILRTLALPGVTLSRVPGVWDTSTGGVTVSWAWIGVTNGFTVPTVLQVGGNTFTPTEEHLSKYVMIHEYGTRGVTVTAKSNSAAVQIPVTATPQRLYTADEQQQPVGEPIVGSILRKPTISWRNPLFPLDMTVVGGWVVDNVQLPPNDTYTITAAGQYVTWREVAINAAGENVWSSPAILTLPAYYETLRDEIFAGVLDAVSDAPPGASGMRIYSARNDSSAAYTRDPDAWYYPLRHQFTGVAACKVWNELDRSFGGVLITPQHVLYCAHAHPWAAGNWAPNRNLPPTLLRFVTAGNVTITRTQVWEAVMPGLDLCVATLDSPVDTELLNVAPILRLATLRDYHSVAPEWATRYVDNQALSYLMGYGDTYPPPGAVEPNGFPVIGCSQEGIARPGYSVPPPPPGADYPTPYHPQMVYIKNLRTVRKPETPPVTLLDAWNYAVYSGDSGSPIFLLHRGKAYFSVILTTAPFGGVWVHSHVGQIRQLIELSDAGAIQAGRLSAPTGCDVTVVDPASLF